MLRVTLSKCLLMAAINALLCLSGCLDPNTGTTTGGIGADAASDVAPELGHDVGHDIVQDTVQDVPIVDIIKPHCQDITCDDGNDCTTDSCDESNGQCFFAPANDGAACDECFSCNAGQCLPDDVTVNPGCNTEPTLECNSIGAISASKALLLPAGTTVKVAGPAVMGPAAICDDSNCGNCSADVAISADDGSRLALDSGELGTQEPPWACLESQCDATLSCAPQIANVQYWVWGTLEDYDPFGTGNALASRKLAVQGWCLKNTAPTFAGVYKGTYTDAYEDTYSLTMTVELSSEDTWEVQVAGEDAHKTEISDGAMVYQSSMADPFSDWAKTTLKVSKNTLYGDYLPGVPPEGPSSDPGGGTVHLTREAGQTLN